MAILEVLTGTSPTSIFLTVCVVIVFAGLASTLELSSLNEIPGPWYTRFSRLPLKSKIIGHARFYWIDRLHKKYGKVVRLSPHELSVIDEESFKRIYSFSEPFKKSVWYENLDIFPRKTIFLVRDHPSHQLRRRFFAKPFSKTVIRQEWEEVVRSNSQLAVEKILGDIKKHGKTDILRWYTFMAADVVATLMFGESFNQLAKEEKNDYLIAMDRLMEGAGLAYELPIMRTIAKYLPINSIRILFGSSDVLMDYADIAIKNTRENTGKKTFFSQVIEKEGDKGLDDLDIRCEAAGELVAGTETVSTVLAYLVWAVISHPKIQKDLEKEIAALPVDFDDAKLEELPFLSAVIDETLRLYTTVPSGLPREVPPGGALLHGYQIPPGTIVSCQAYTTHRDPEVYENPYEFNPYRWINGLDKSKVIYHPFGAGARMCQGQNLAFMELRYGAVHMFQAAKGQLRASPGTNEGMELLDLFVMKPKARQCEMELASN